MRTCIFLLGIIFIIVTSSFAADFSPTLLKISADQAIQYDFDGSNLNIPINITGTSAGVVFLVFTKDQADLIGPNQDRKSVV